MISASGVPCNWDASGVVEGFGVGNNGGQSIETEPRLFLGGAVFFRFFGDTVFEGDVGSGGMVCSGSKICDVSISSVFRVARIRAAVRGVEGTSVVFRRVWRLGLRCGAGVKPSSLSSSFAGGALSTSSSESSTITFFRVATLRDGRVGEMVVIILPDSDRVMVAVFQVAIVYLLTVYCITQPYPF